jgi:hypothetical protein
MGFSTIEGTGIGKAYGFFECPASKQRIEAALPLIREDVKIPSDLELTLIEGMDNLKGDAKLIALAQQAKRAGIQYVLEAKYPGASNEQASIELNTILNQAYLSSLYNKGDQLNREIVYEQNGEYLFRE